MMTYLPGAGPPSVYTGTVGHQPEGRPHPWKEGELCSDGDGGGDGDDDSDGDGDSGGDNDDDDVSDNVGEKERGSSMPNNFLDLIIISSSLHTSHHHHLHQSSSP